MGARPDRGGPVAALILVLRLKTVKESDAHRRRMVLGDGGGAHGLARADRLDERAMLGAEGAKIEGRGVGVVEIHARLLLDQPVLRLEPLMPAEARDRAVKGPIG